MSEWVNFRWIHSNRLHN